MVRTGAGVILCVAGRHGKQAVAWRNGLDRVRRSAQAEFFQAGRGNRGRSERERKTEWQEDQNTPASHIHSKMEKQQSHTHTDSSSHVMAGVLWQQLQDYNLYSFPLAIQGRDKRKSHVCVFLISLLRPFRSLPQPPSAMSRMWSETHLVSACSTWSDSWAELITCYILISKTV